MKAVLGSLLAAALLVGTGHALTCYTCDTVANNADCMTSSKCATGLDSYCMSSYASGSGASYISKSCSKTCSEGSATLAGVTAKVTCCSSDLCNGANSAKLSTTLLSLAAAISALMVRALL
ncbi:prostate stem cell antigen-like [Lissotriton helveticus]